MCKLSKREILNSMIVEGFDALSENERSPSLVFLDSRAWIRAREINALQDLIPQFKVLANLAN